MKFWARIVLLSFLILTSLGGSHAMGEFMFVENPLIGKQAPEFTLKTLKGENMSLSQFRGGDATILFFWATWCPHCRDELKGLGKRTEEFEQKGIKIALIDLEEDPKLVGSFLEKFKISYPVFMDETSQVAEQYNIIGVPTIFLIDKDGIVRFMGHDLPNNYVELLTPDQKKKT